LLNKGYKYAVAIGILAGITVFSKGGGLEKIKNYQENAKFFPKSGYVQTVEDGDTITLKSGTIVRLVGIDAPDRGAKNYEEVTQELIKMILNKKVYLEYDRYQDDVYSRVLAWVWVDCEKTPNFLPADYMHKSGNESMPGLTDNPKGCQKGKLVNAEMVKSHLATPIFYKDRGKLKYENLIITIP